MTWAARKEQIVVPLQIASGSLTGSTGELKLMALVSHSKVGVGAGDIVGETYASWQHS